MSYGSGAEAMVRTDVLEHFSGEFGTMVHVETPTVSQHRFKIERRLATELADHQTQFKIMVLTAGARARVEDLRCRRRP